MENGFSTLTSHLPYSPSRVSRYNPRAESAFIRGSYGSLIVGGLARTQYLLEQAGAVITQLPTPTIIMLYARHPDGSVNEYVQQGLPQLVGRSISKRCS
jgi:hypothetical protein